MEQYGIKENFTFRKPLDQRFYRENYNKQIHWCLGSNVQINQTSFKSDLFIFDENKGNEPSSSGLTLEIYGLSTGGIRIRISPSENEKFERYDVSKEEAIILQSVLESHVNIESNDQSNPKEITLSFPEHKSLVIQKDPFTITLNENGKETVIVNSVGQLIFEHGNNPVKNERHHFVHNDPIPQGACAVGLDFTFLSKNLHLSGLPERASPLPLLDTKPDSPLRLFNSDSNKYTADNPVHLYGSVPFVMVHGPSISCGLFWINSSDTYATIATVNKSASSATFNGNDDDDECEVVAGKKISFLSETGFVDFVLFSGSFDSILDSYTSLTGRPFMPPLFSFGYHQCKWGYLSQAEVESVMKGLDDCSIPYDAIWLDVDHLKKFSPFEIDEKKFPNVGQLSENLDKDKRHLVRLSDPHFPTRKSHKQYSECIANSDFHMKEPNGKPFKGFCWPGRCIWPDFLNPECRLWYSKQFSKTEPLNVHVWNDMNEPTIFMADQFTFPKYVVHYNGTESRATHNIYGVLNTSATFAGCAENERRPFILTRSFWSGTQRYSFVWTGDNTASVDHMKISLDMVVSLGLSGLPFSGADVGGFFGSPEHIFIAHWMRLASYTYPFFREHCIRNAARREPFLFTGKAFEIAKQTIYERYKLISFWYTKAHNAHITGTPITKPLWAVFPEIERFHGNLENNGNGLPVIVGETLLVNFSESELPPGRWYQLWSGREKHSKQTAQTVQTANTNTTKDSNENDNSNNNNNSNNDDDIANVDDDDIPFIESDNFVLLRGGKILPVYDLVEKSAELTVKNPLALIVAVDENGKAEGEVFIDDGLTFSKACIHRKFLYENGVLTSQSLASGDEEDGGQLPEEIANAVIDSVRIYGEKEPTSVENGLAFNYEKGVTIINGINHQVGKDLEIKINF